MGTAAAVVGGSVVGGVLSSRSQRKAADKQADAIKDGQKISSEAAAQAREDVLATYAPAFKDVAKGIQNARNDLLAGRISTIDVLDNAFLGAGRTLQTNAQQAMDALVGGPQQQSGLRFAAGGPSGSISQPSSLRDASKKRSTSELINIIESQKPKDTSRSTDVKPIESYSGENKAIQRDIDSQPFLSKREKNRLKQIASKGADAKLNFADEYRRITGYATGDEAKAAYAKQQALTGDSPELKGTLLQRPTSLGQTQTLAAPQGNYGLSGAESALRQAERGQLGAYGKAAQQSLGSIREGFSGARDDLSQSEADALSALRSGASQGRRDISTASQRAMNLYQPYRAAGRGAINREAALSGALGPEAQARAFEEYTESPGQKYLREQQEKALLRSSAAIGGLGGGNVRTALQEQAAGIASQNYQQDLENLRSLASRGQQAAGASANIVQQRGAQLANIANQLGLSESQVQQSTGTQLAQLARDQGLSESQVQQLLGQQVAGTIGQTGQQISGLRYGTGQDISRTLLGAGGQLSQLQSGFGSQLANIDQQTAANLANLSAQYGQQTSGLRTGLGSTLANIGVGQGSQQANLATQLGTAQAAGVTNPIGNIASQLTGLVAYNPSLFGLGA